MTSVDPNLATSRTHPPNPVVSALASSAGFVPSLPPPPIRQTGSDDPLSLAPGHQVDDFQVIAVLGRGAFGVVYLAWQQSLGRQVALKVSPCVGQEGRTLARLDHPHIVRVHSESVRDGMRWLCMQYVPSIDLDHVLQQLKSRAATWTGQELLTVVDDSLPLSAGFDPEQLADRQRLSELDHVGAVCWIVARLADAVGHAHRNGVLHRDLKPGNVLVSQYGRPMLVDFNLANSSLGQASDSQIFGGTLPYMSPEHLDAFNPEHPAQPVDVTQQSDIYSLGVMMYQLLTGELPFATPTGAMTQSERVRRMADERRQPDGVWSQPSLLAEPALTSVIRRCLAPDPADRWRSAEELSKALGAVNHLREALADVERSSRWPAWWRRHPFIALAIVGLVPHIFGSLVNIPYNLLRIVGPDRQAVFFWLVNIYNAVLYPLCIALCLAVVWPVARHWRRLERRKEPIDTEDIARVRRRLVNFPLWVACIALLGWLPGAVWFPWGLHVFAGPLLLRHVLHFQLSVALSGLIALTYSALGVLCLTAGMLYPRVCTDPLAFERDVATELRPWRWLLWLIPFMAGTIPLVGAVLMVGTSPRSFADDAEYLCFRWLTTGLIALGMIGFQVAVWATASADAAIQALLRAKSS